MKLIPKSNNLFKKDVKRIVKRRYNVTKMQEIVDFLCAAQTLPARCRPHKLTGNYANHWECHIEPDWLLIYYYDGVYLKLIRTGTHADLFGK